MTQSNRKLNKLIKSPARVLQLGLGFLLFKAESVLAFENIGEIAENLAAGTHVLTKLMLVICITMGIGMIIAAVVHYRAHRYNPKLVPLDRPVFYLVLGIFLLSIPFWGQIFARTGSSVDMEAKEKQAAMQKSQCRDIDAPLTDWGNKYNH